MKKAFEELTEESIIQLHEKVTGMKQWRELEIRYMAFEELLRGRERKGKSEGKAEGIIELLEDWGMVPQELKEIIMLERDLEILKHWLKLAASVYSVEDFQQKMEVQS